jgi:hypothetical protein
MGALKQGIGASVPLKSVLRTEDLEWRPSRPPDYQAIKPCPLAQELPPTDSVLQWLVDIALKLCRGHSATAPIGGGRPPGVGSS